jgi:5-methylcytosine-specific restriction endonuclease McrA
MVLQKVKMDYKTRQKKSKEKRDESIQKGEKSYISATQCKKCGSYEKYVTSYGCVDCSVKKNLHKLYDNNLMDKYKTRSKINAKTYRYRTRKRNQMPETADNEKILWFYKESERLTEETGIIHHVDHIVPISKGGLHHQDNLQVLTKKENLSKGNKIL